MQGHTSPRWWESAILRSHQVDAGGSVIMKESADVRVISGETVLCEMLQKYVFSMVTSAETYIYIKVRKSCSLLMPQLKNVWMSLHYTTCLNK